LEGIEKITGKKVINIEIDLADAEAVKNIYPQLTDIVGIIHFAAYKSVGESVENPLMYFRNNNDSLINILEAAATCDIPYFVFSSSCTVYGNVDELPVVESTPMGKGRKSIWKNQTNGRGNDC
jgi:UDP-glucose 4-epimerase